MSTYRSSRILLGLVGAATVAALVVPGAAFAKGKPANPGGEEETAAFSLSVPALFVGDDPFGLTCGAAIYPDGQPLNGFFVPGYYYVQGVSKWQAQCQEGLPAAEATAKFGDNLTGTAAKVVGRPIRVELNLFAAAATPMTGWEVVKLEDTLDRESAYGTAATPVGDGFASSPVITLPTGVWGPGTLKIYLQGNADNPVVNTDAKAEINATGKVVYGHNLRVTASGTYVIEYSFSAVTIASVPQGGTISLDRRTVSLPIVVTSGGGGGGGKRP